MAFEIHLNGKQKVLSSEPPLTAANLVAELELRPDRIALEVNGEIVPRRTWDTAEVQAGDRVEVVHFVGGGLSAVQRFAGNTSPKR